MPLLVPKTSLNCYLPAVIDFTDKKILEFSYEHKTGPNPLIIQLVNKSGKSHVARRIENKQHIICPFVGEQLEDINRINILGEALISDINYIEPPPKRFENKIVIQFDDGFVNTHKLAFPIFKKYSAVATVGIITFRIGGKHAGHEILTASQLLELQSAGWEIASHGMTHKLMEDQFGEESVIRQFKESLDTLKTMGFNVKHFIYPYTRYGTISKKVCPEYYESASIGMPPNQNHIDFETMHGRTDRYILNRTPVRTTTTLESIKIAIEDSIRYQTLLILCFHHVGTPIDDGPESKLFWAPEQFECLLQWLQDQNIKTITTSEAINYYGL